MPIRRPGLRMVLFLLALTAVLLVSACTDQEPAITTEDQVPQDQVVDAEDGEEAAEEEGETDPEGGSSVTVVAIDNEFTEFDDTAAAGTVTWELINEGNLQHDIVIEEAGDTKVADTMGGETDTGDIDLEAGEYTFYCSIPGHRATMEETITIE